MAVNRAAIVLRDFVGLIARVLSCTEFRWLAGSGNFGSIPTGPKLSQVSLRRTSKPYTGLSFNRTNVSEIPAEFLALFGSRVIPKKYPEDLIGHRSKKQTMKQLGDQLGNDACGVWCDANGSTIVRVQF